ncbi:hypothetical protein B0H14DRAFT_2693310 [Mycena olivaceomarginata]|nr:hypothetical protein B0H14DRAFT_2693310 [Mycena olivaceomarginata]
MHTCPPCARTPVPFIRTHDDVRSMCPSRATLYYVVILGVTFPCSTRIPATCAPIHAAQMPAMATPSFDHSTLPRLPPFSLPLTNVVFRYDPQKLRSRCRLSPHTKCHGGLSGYPNPYPPRCFSPSSNIGVMHGRTRRAGAGVLLSQSGIGATGCLRS